MTRFSERVVQAAHPDLGPDDVRRTAEAYRAISAECGGVPTGMAVQSAEAERKSDAGENIAP
jgi:hypothetical protein